MIRRLIERLRAWLRALYVAPVSLAERLSKPEPCICRGCLHGRGCDFEGWTRERVVP